MEGFPLSVSSVPSSGPPSPYVQEPEEVVWFAVTEQAQAPQTENVLLVTSRSPHIVRFDPPLPVDENGDVEIVAIETLPFDEDKGKTKVKIKKEIKKKGQRCQVTFGENEMRIFQETPEVLRAEFGERHITVTDVKPTNI